MVLNKFLQVSTSPLLRRSWPCRCRRRHFHTTIIPLSSAVDLSHAIHDPRGPSKAGPPLLITHGLLGSKANWNSIAKAVVKDSGRRVVIFDARNHGDSPKIEDHSYDLMAQDVLHLSKTIAGDRFSLMGHSMGGRTAMVVALRWPEKIEKLIVVDVSPVSLQSEFHSEMEEYLKTMMSINFNTGKKLLLSEARKIGDEALKNIVSSPSVRAFLLTNLAESEGKIFWKPNLPVLLKTVGDGRIGEFPADLLGKTLKSPALFIRGENSTYIPDKDLPEIRKMFPNSEVETIKNAGHWPHSDNSKDFLKCVIQFLNS